MIVYKITNLINGKAYIGITRQALARRWKDHRALSRRGAAFPICRAVRKYGAENFRVEEICPCSCWEELVVCERALIAEHGTYVPRGYNATAGGEGGFARTLTQEYRNNVAARMRVRVAGGHHPGFSFAGRQHSPESRRKLSEAKKKAYAEGRGRVRQVGEYTPSPETRKKIGEARKGHVHSAETKMKIGNGNRGLRRSAEQKQRMSDAKRKKLTSFDIAAIMALRNAGVRPFILASVYRVSSSYVSVITRSAADAK